MMFDCQSLFTSVPGARIGRRIKGEMPLLQILGSEVDWRHIRHCKDTERYAISGKRGRRKTAKKKKKKKDCGHCLAEAVSQGFAGENYARRASFSTGKRHSRLTLTGRRRQATFAGVFCFLNGDYKV